MSLTSELKSNKELIELLNTHIIVKSTTLLETRANISYELYGDRRDSAIVGTAYDYLLRFKLEKDNGALSLSSVEGSVLAVSVQPTMVQMGVTPVIKEYKKAYFIIDSYFKDKDVKLRDFLSAIIYFSCIDYIARNKSFDEVALVDSVKKLSFQEEFSSIYADLLNLSKTLSKGNFLKQFENIDELYTNPTFTNSSELGGADADLIIDKTLIDIKTVTVCKITRDMLHQIICYYILGIYDDIKIKKVGIFFSRYNRLEVYKIRDLISKDSEKILVDYFADTYDFC